MTEKKKIIFYQSSFCPIGGVETMAYNWCWWMRNYFDITILYCSGDVERIRKMSRLAKMEKYEEGKTYECDIFFRNSVWGKIPQNIKAKRMIEMRHANYKYLLDNGWLFSQYNDMGIKEIVGCGEFVSKMSHEALGDNPTTIKNILLPRKKTEKIIKLISCTRLDPQKGWNRMLQLMEMMKRAKIKFEWNIFTNNPQKCNYEEVHFYKQRYDIWDYLADADYTVLLSNMEGLPYTVQESLLYQVPCIVTDVGGCTELIQDGINGHVVPLDMNFDVNKIKKIPKCKEYYNHSLEDWLKYLKYDGEEIDKNKLIQEYEEEKEMKVIVRATRRFEGITDAERNVIPKEGDEWIVERERADYLASKGVVQIIGEVEEPKKDVKEEPIKEEKPIKKTRKTTKKAEK